MANVLGVDCSKWQGDMDWEKCAAAGAKFAFIRAGSIDNVSGNCYIDYQFMRNASFAPEHMPVGYYWYFRPNHDAVKQADFFCDLIENEEQVLSPVIDIETSGNRSSRQVTDAMVAFIAKVYDRLKVWPIVYSRSYWLNANTLTHPFWKECDRTFWQYIANSNAAVEYGGEGPPGGDDDIDLNYFNGDQAAFDEYCDKPFPPSPVLPPSIGVKVNIEIDGKDVKYQGHINKVE